MAGNTIDINLSVQDKAGTVKQRTKEAQALNKELETAQKLATGTKAGSKALRAAYGGGVASGEGTAYGQARGSMGATGASARDFANQAQGLGGLVRLYATWAANVFAVSAAFNALREAMNTTNMIQGMNQLSAASGVAMGSMAKSLVEVTGGAVSMRQAVESTVKAVSSGLSQEQFEKLGQVATKASRALGVNMDDALSRLTRGITKLEPELLDELGIFTKVGAASSAYAKSIGKSADSLTDFEKRQAFANAVLEEGLQKFSKIEVDANPYDKLAASIRNLSQSTLEIVNKALGPLIDALSSSPTGLSVIIAGLGTLLLKQAIPAFGQYRESLAQSLEQAQDLAQVKTQKAQAASAAAVKNALSGIDNFAQQSADRAAEKLDVLETLVTKNRGKFGKTVKDILSTEDLTTISEDKINTIEKFSRSNKRLSGIYTELASSIREAKLAQEEYLRKEQEALALQSKRDKSLLSDVARAKREEAAAKAAVASRQIIATASDDVGTAGLTGAFKNLFSNIKGAEDMGPIRKGITGIAGAASIATSAVTRLLGAFSSFMSWVGIAIFAFTTIKGLLSTNSEEVAKFSTAVDHAGEATKTAAQTAELYGEQLSVASLEAKANSIDGITNSMRNLISAFDAANTKAGWFDKLSESIADAFGRGLQDTLAGQIGAQVEAGLANIDSPRLKQLAEEKLKGILGVQKLTADSIEDAIDNLDPKKTSAVTKEVQKLFTSINTQGLAAKATVKGVEEAFKSTETAAQALANSLKKSDPLADYAVALVKQGAALEQAFKDPTTSAATLKSILTDVSKIKLFPADVQVQLGSVAEAYKGIGEQLDRAYTKQAELNRKVKDLSVRPSGELYQEGYIPRMRELSAARSQLLDINKVAATLRKQQEELFAKLGNISTDSIDKGFALLLERSKLAAQASAIESKKALLGAATQTPETIRQTAKLEASLIDIQIKELTIAEDQLRSQKEANEILKQLLLTNELTELKRNADRNDQPRIRELETQLTQSRDRQKAVSTRGGVAAAVAAGKLSKSDETTLELLRQEQGVSEQISSLQAKKLTTTQLAEITAIRKEFDDAAKRGEARLAELNAEFETRKREEAFSQLSPSERLAEETRFTESTQELRKFISTASQQAAVAGDERLQRYGLNVTASLDQSRGTLSAAAEKFVREEAEAARQRTTTAQKSASELALQNLRSESELLSQSNSQYTTRSSLLAEQLQLDLEQGKISQTTFDLRSQALARETLAEEKAFKLRKEQYDLDIKIAELEQNKLGASPEQRALIDQQIGAEKTLSTVRKTGLEDEYTLKERILEQNNSLTTSQKAVVDVFRQGFDNMSTALEDFVKTGKISFSSLVESMLADMARLALRQATMSMFETMSPGIMSAVKSFWPFAQGGAFNSGVQAFAKGGTFTNSIVTSPTLFKFAKGTGLMGEAGPEAIMPLARDSTGTLGVRAQTAAPSVDVVVNNYSGEKAETKESIDSRGNRKIEVIIGEMVAAETQRPNSAMQNTMRGTFGVAPMLTRR